MTLPLVLVLPHTCCLSHRRVDLLRKRDLLLAWVGLLRQLELLLVWVGLDHKRGLLLAWVRLPPVWVGLLCTQHLVLGLRSIWVHLLEEGLLRTLEPQVARAGFLRQVNRLGKSVFLGVS